MALQHQRPIGHHSNWTMTAVNTNMMSQGVIFREEGDSLDLDESNLVRLLTTYVSSINETYTQINATTTERKRRKLGVDQMDYVSKLLCELANENPPIIKQLSTSLLKQAAQKFFSMNYRDCSIDYCQLPSELSRTYENSLFNRALKQLNWIPEFYLNEYELKPTAMWAGPLYDVCAQYYNLISSSSANGCPSQTPSSWKQRKFIDIMKHLIELGAEVNSTSRLVGLSPLAALARTTGGREGIKVLAEHGAVLPDKYRPLRQTVDAELEILQEITSERYCRNGDSKDMLLQMYIELKSNTQLVVNTLLVNRDEFLSPEVKRFLLQTQLLTDCDAGSHVPSLKSLSRLCIRLKLGDVKVICNSFKLPVPAELQHYVALSIESM